MATIEATGANAGMIEFWNSTAGDRWTSLQEVMDPTLAPLGEAAMDALSIASGDRVIEIGCGCGGTTLELARRVGAAGRVLGVDVSEPMLARAAERVAASGDLPVDLELADAAAHEFPAAAFDAVFSRFGVMFFIDPAAAFANIRSALRPGGRLGFVCWRTLKENPWATIPIDVATNYVDPPQRAGPEDPGPFSFRDPDRIRRILGTAGFEAIEVAPLNIALDYGTTLEGATMMTMRLGPISNAILEAPEDIQRKIADDMAEALRPKLGADGVFLDSGCWVVTANAGAN
jgi:SAM-dependent methyltransferase